MIDRSRGHLVASGHSHPRTVLPTHELEDALPNVEQGWIGERLGMKSRHVAAAHERVVDHAIAATDQALDQAGWARDDLDLVVCGASFLEDLMPPRAAVVAEAVCPRAVAFDLNAACSSFLYALRVALALLETDPSLGRAAVCVSERPTASADYRDSHSSAFFGDSAGCVLVERKPPSEGFALDGLSLLNDARGSEEVRVPRHGHFHHDNRSAFRHVMVMGEQVTRSALEHAGADVDGVRFFVGHQANQTVLSSLGDRLGIPWERQWHNFGWAGNQGAAGVLTAFSEGWTEHRAELRPGDLVVLTTVGSGYSAASAVLRWLG